MTCTARFGPPFDTATSAAIAPAATGPISGMISSKPVANAMTKAKGK